MQDFFSYDADGLRALLESWGQPAYRARQLCEWVWQRGASSYEEMTNLPATLREQLAVEAPLRRATVVRRLEAGDGTRKYLLELADGVRVETVAIPNVRQGVRQGDGSVRQGGETGVRQGDGSLVSCAHETREPSPCLTPVSPPCLTEPSPCLTAAKRLTVCVSSQAGCALGCVFCATGRGGLTRSLHAGEIAEQVRIVSADFGRAATNVVVMGQGEPFANYGATLGALRLLNSPSAFNIGARRITVSTSGITSGIARLAEEPEQFRLAVSLHAATQELRDQLMPGLRKQPLDKLRRALADYRERSGRRVSLEYVLLRDVNDHDSDLQALADFARAVGAHINLLPYNDTGDTGTVPLSPEDAARSAQAVALLRAAGIETTLRRSRGAEIAAACGQLANQD